MKVATNAIIKLEDGTIVHRKFTWVPPTDRFCKYGPEDEKWMRPLGLGTEKLTAVSFTRPGSLVTSNYV